MPKAKFESRTVLEQIQAKNKGQGKAYEEREELRMMIASIPEGQVLRVSPDGETPRKLKRMVTEAGKDIDKKVKYVEDGDDLIVFVLPPVDPNAPRRGRPRAAATA